MQTKSAINKMQSAGIDVKKQGNNYYCEFNLNNEIKRFSFHDAAGCATCFSIRYYNNNNRFRQGDRFVSFKKFLIAIKEENSA
jgi:hypothetical protein